MRHRPRVRLRTALSRMEPAQQREFLQQIIDRLSDEDLRLLTTYAVGYVDPNEVDGMLNLNAGERTTEERLKTSIEVDSMLNPDAGELMTEERLKAIAAEAGLQAKRYRHRGTEYYMVRGLYKDPKDKPGTMKQVTRHVSRVNKLRLVSDETVKDKIKEVLTELEIRRKEVGSPPRRKRKT